MPPFQKPRIAQFVYVLNFLQVQQQIRFAQGDAEVAFGSFGAGQSQQTNVPDNVDPSVPRIVFVKDNRNISISQQAVQLTHGYVFDPNVPQSLETQLEEMKREISIFHTQALGFQRNRTFGSTALVVVVNFDTDTSLEELHKFVFDRFLTVDPLGDLASVQFAVGFKSDDLFINLSGSVYELRQLDLKQEWPGSVSQTALMLNAQSGKLLSKGVQFTVDVNDRPRFSSRTVSAGPMNPDVLFDRAQQVISEKLPTIIDGAK